MGKNLYRSLHVDLEDCQIPKIDVFLFNKNEKRFRCCKRKENIHKKEYVPDCTVFG